MAAEKVEAEVKLGVPVHRIWRAAHRSEVLLPLVVPDVFASGEMKGDGGVGTVRVYHCGPAIQEGFTIQERIDEIDEETHTIRYTVLEGDPRYKSMKAIIKYVSSEDGTTTVANCRAEYETVVGEEGEPDEIIEMISLIQTSLSHYLLANPAYS